MPRVIKKRVTKKIALKEEEVKGIAADAIALIRERKKTFILLFSALIIALTVFAAFIFYTTSLSRKAYSIEREAYNYYYGINLKDPLTAEERLKKALELYQRSLKVKPTPLSQFYIGNCYYKLGNYSNAINAYNVLIGKYPGEGMLPLVYQKLASSYIKSGRNDDALNTLEMLKKFKNGAFKDSALIEEARLYEATGRPEDAQKRYEELIKEFPASPWSDEARAKIKSKKGKPTP